MKMTTAHLDSDWSIGFSSKGTIDLSITWGVDRQNVVLSLGYAGAKQLHVQLGALLANSRPAEEPK